MITVNDRKYEWVEEQTVEQLINFLKNSGEYAQLFASDISIQINKKLLSVDNYKRITIQNGDKISLLPKFYGG